MIFTRSLKTQIKTLQYIFKKTSRKELLFLRNRILNQITNLEVRKMNLFLKLKFLSQLFDGLTL